jgi:NAD(P)-dependent dehydrogenase (short-subunit alcohol dehydrogenase family)
MTTKIYAITGACSGIGLHVYQQLCAEEHKVIGIDLAGSEIEADLSTPAGRKEAAGELTSLCPEGLDGLITCAGLGGHVADAGQVIAINYYGTVELVEHCVPLLKKRGGHVVTIASNSIAIDGLADTSLVEYLLTGEENEAKAIASTLEQHLIYASSKKAIAHWSRVRATNLIRDHKIRLNCIAPGMTETPLVSAGREHSDSDRRNLEQFASTIPAGFTAQPDMIADAVLFFLSTASRYIAGQVLFVDGGHEAFFRPAHV